MPAIKNARATKKPAAKAKKSTKAKEQAPAPETPISETAHTNSELGPPPAPEATPAEKPKAKKGKKASAPKAEKKAKKVSGLDAAAIVLAAVHPAALHIEQIMTQIADQQLWKSDGKTPAATVYAAIIREIASKGPKSRFARGTEKGTFCANKPA